MSAGFCGNGRHYRPRRCLLEKARVFAGLKQEWRHEFTLRLHGDYLTSYLVYKKGQFMLVTYKCKHNVDICACTTRSSPQRDLCHTETNGCSLFTAKCLTGIGLWHRFRNRGELAYRRIQNHKWTASELAWGRKWARHNAKTLQTLRFR